MTEAAADHVPRSQPNCVQARARKRVQGAVSSESLGVSRNRTPGASHGEGGGENGRAGPCGTGPNPKKGDRKTEHGLIP